MRAPKTGRKLQEYKQNKATYSIISGSLITFFSMDPLEGSYDIDGPLS